MALKTFRTRAFDGQLYNVGGDQISAVYYPSVKLLLGDLDTDDGPVSAANPMPIVTNTGEPLTNLYQVLTLDGDGTGTANMDADYSSAADDFYIQPGASQVFRIIGLGLTMSLPGTDAFSLVGYGGSDTPLTNGMKLIQSKNAVETTIITATRNLTWFSVGQPTAGEGGKGGSAASFYTIQFRFPQTIRLDGAASTPDQLIMRVNDNLTEFLTNLHTSFVAGFIE